MGTESTRDQFRFSYALRVRYHEVDWQQIVYNGVYFHYLSTAWTEYLRALGLDYRAMVAAGCDPRLVRCTIEFRRPAVFDDLLDVLARMSRLGKSSLTMEFRIHRHGEAEPLVLAEAVYVNVDRATGTSSPLPAFFRDRVAAFEQITSR